MVNVRCGGSADSVSPTPLWVLPQPTHLETTIVPVSATGLNEYVCSLTDVSVPCGQISVHATGNRLPSYLGSSFSVIAPVMAAVASNGHRSALGGLIAVGVIQSALTSAWRAPQCSNERMR